MNLEFTEKAILRRLCENRNRKTEFLNNLKSRAVLNFEIDLKSNAP